MKTQCDNVCWRRATNECDAIISVFANAEAAGHAFSRDGKALTSGTTRRFNVGRNAGLDAALTFATSTADARTSNSRNTGRGHFRYTGYHAVLIINRASKIPDLLLDFRERQRGRLGMARGAKTSPSGMARVMLRGRSVVFMSHSNIAQRTLNRKVCSHAAGAQIEFPHGRI
jgi:hypothetical protein